MEYLLKLNGVRIDKKRIAVAGSSMGGYFAASIGTTYPIFTSMMLLHSKCVSPA